MDYGERLRGMLSGAVDAGRSVLEQSWLVDQAGRIRYGMPTTEKEKLARSGLLPGSPKTDDADVLDRYASGMLAARTWGGGVQPIADRLHLAGLDDPDVQSWATTGKNEALRNPAGVSQAIESMRANDQAEALGRRAMAMREPGPRPSPQPSYPLPAYSGGSRR